MITAGDVLDGKYRIIREIGRGGMSVVYLAVDTRLNKMWAVKEVIVGDDSSGANYEGLKSEIEVIKKLDHPVLPRIVDVIYSGEGAYIVMDYIEGKPLNQLLKEQGTIKPELVVKWSVCLCEALCYLHSMSPQVIYRDMKPSNIILKSDGGIKLIDFGAALEITHGRNGGGYAFGTRGYAAPEQYEGGYNGIDTRTDIYSLGATMYTLLTGVLPEIDNGCVKSMRAWNHRLSDGLDRIVLKCMENDPERRYQSCKELLYHLHNYKRMEGAFKSKCKRVLYSFVASLLLALLFGAAAINGYRGIIKEKDHKDKNTELLMEVGLEYFRQEKDYEKSAYYFGLVDEEECPEAKAYKVIALSMCRLDVNCKELSETLIMLESSVDSKTLSDEKLLSYELMCDVYVKNCSRLENAYERILSLARKGLDTLDGYEDEDTKRYYHIAFNRYLISGYEGLNEDSLNYERALECCDDILQMVSKDDSMMIGAINSRDYRKSMLCKKAELLIKLSRMDEARQVYEACEEEYGDDSLEIYVEHLSLLCSMEEAKTTDVEMWDYDLLYDVYERGSRIAGIEEDQRWRRLAEKLEPLFDTKEGS